MFNMFPDLTFCKKIYGKYVGISLKIEKMNHELEGLYFTALILAGIIPLDNQRMCRYCQFSLNE